MSELIKIFEKIHTEYGFIDCPNCPIEILCDSGWYDIKLHDKELRRGCLMSKIGCLIEAKQLIEKER